MDGIHDLGGIQGFGPIPVAKGDAAFRDLANWEKRMWGLSRSNIARGVTIDWYRHCIERMVPKDYLSFAYFNKWCTTYLVLLIDNGTVSMEDVMRGHVDRPDQPIDAKSLEDVLNITRKANRSFETRSLATPAFSIGDQVTTHRLATGNHTRLPRYARAARGTIIAHHGSHYLPDMGAQGIEAGENLYTVAFAATELWGGQADRRDEVMLDLWESYLVQV